jgi:hypothetical protein
MNPQDKVALTKFTLVAKKIIYDPQRMKMLLQMMGSKLGALHAVHAIIAIIEKNKPIPPAIIQQLGVNAYLIMVDVAQSVTGHKADPKIVHEVMAAIHQTTDQAPQPVQPQQIPAQGIIGSRMGVPA